MGNKEKSKEFLFTMEYLHHKFISFFNDFSPPFFLVTLTIVLLSTSLIIFCSRSKSAASNLPPGPWKLPIIGNLHQLIGDQPHRRLNDLAQKYGPDVMWLQLGELSNIVISSPEAAKQVMKIHDLAFASRPLMFGPDIIFDGYKDIAFAPYGEHWRQMRKLCVLELLSTKRVRSFRRIREEEVSKLIDSLSSSALTTNNKPVDLSALVTTLTGCVTSRAAFGKRQELNDAFMMVVENISDVLAGFKISDLYPSLKFLASFTGFKETLEKMHKASDSVLHCIIEEHKSKRSSARKKKDRDDDDVEKEDLIDVFLNLQENQNFGVPITDEVMKAVTLELFLAGIETSATAIAWAMSEVVKDARVLQNVQDEVRKVFNDTSSVEEASLHKLNYLDIVISESLRLHPPLPLLIPRENDEKAELNDYNIPMKTKVIVNVWAINRDARYWSDPHKFYPERFMDCSTDYKGNYHQFIPFGAGRRMCPGVLFGLSIVKLTLANLLFHFNWKVPDKSKQENLDMTEVFGVVLKRKHALRLIPIPYKG
ncbi:Cytochrome P450 71D8 [Linum grandiflorum]